VCRCLEAEVREGIMAFVDKRNATCPAS